MFPRWPRHQTLDKDLRRAGIEKLDGRGCNADFHSLRYFFCTRMALALPIQKVRILMRHKTIKTTVDLYCDLGIEDLVDDVWVLPPVTGRNPAQHLDPRVTPLLPG